MQKIVTLFIAIYLLTPIMHAANIKNSYGEFVVVGDQWINKSQFEQSVMSIALPYNPISAMGFKPAKVVIWQNGVLPIQFKDDVPKYLQNLVWLACSEWAQHANITCHKGKYKNRALTISRSFMGVKVGCWSMLGSWREWVMGWACP